MADNRVFAKSAKWDEHGIRVAFDSEEELLNFGLYFYEQKKWVLVLSTEHVDGKTVGDGLIVTQEMADKVIASYVGAPVVKT